MASKRWLRGLIWFVSLPALASLLLIAAWVASNWNDATPQPRPAALQLPSPSLPDDRNAYFALAGLRAAADRDPSAAGRSVWKQQLATAVEPKGSFVAPADKRPAGDADSALGELLPSMAGTPLVCNEPMDVCVELWIDEADALGAQRTPHALLGQRCERLLERELPFKEALAPMRTAAEPLAQHSSGASECSKWFLSGAVLAWKQQDAFWLPSMRQLVDGLQASIRAQVVERAHSAEPGVLDFLTWRNTLGTMVFAVGQASYVSYLARQADLDLHHETTVLAVRAVSDGVPASDRRSWLAQQPLSTMAGDRITWSDDGMALSARTWQETSVPGAQPAPRDAIRITWPSPR
jgi:hypothetical protein